MDLRLSPLCSKISKKLILSTIIHVPCIGPPTCSTCNPQQVQSHGGDQDTRGNSYGRYMKEALVDSGMLITSAQFLFWF